MYRSDSADDERFMLKAWDMANNSLDTQTKVSIHVGSPLKVISLLLCIQVGAVIVNPLSKEIVGKGYNRKPVGCEDRFCGNDNELFEKGKRHYGK